MPFTCLCTLHNDSFSQFRQTIFCFFLAFHTQNPYHGSGTEYHQAGHANAAADTVKDQCATAEECLPLIDEFIKGLK